MNREWHSITGRLIASIEEGVLDKPEVAPCKKHPYGRCASYLFPEADGTKTEWNHPFRALVFCDPEFNDPKIPASQPQCVFGQFMGSVEEAEQYIESHLPIRNLAASLDNNEKVMRGEAWRYHGALRPSSRKRLQRLRKKYGSDYPVHYHLTDADLKAGFSFELFRAAYDWRSYGSLNIARYIEVRDDPKLQAERAAGGYAVKFFERDIADARKAVADYQKLIAPGVPASMQQEARGWVKWQNLPDPLTLFPSEAA